MEKMIGKYVVVRADRAGVFAGTLTEKSGTEVIMEQARRIWYWDGAASLSEMAINGVSKPENCKFPAPLQKILVLGVIEIIPCTKKAEESLKGVPIWSKA
jgi:hypothetical protein